MKSIIDSFNENIKCSCGNSTFTIKNGIWTAYLICKKCRKEYKVSK